MEILLRKIGVTQPVHAFAILCEVAQASHVQRSHFVNQDSVELRVRLPHCETAVGQRLSAGREGSWVEGQANFLGEGRDSRRIQRFERIKNGARIRAAIEIKVLQQGVCFHSVEELCCQRILEVDIKERRQWFLRHKYLGWSSAVEEYGEAEWHFLQAGGRILSLIPNDCLSGESCALRIAQDAIIWAVFDS